MGEKVRAICLSTIDMYISTSDIIQIWKYTRNYQDKIKLSTIQIRYTSKYFSFSETLLK